MHIAMTDRYAILTPAIVLFSYVVLACVYYGFRCATARAPRVTDLDRRPFSQVMAFFAGFWIWLLSPIERLVVRSGMNPNTITIAAMVACIAGGVSIATGHLATAGWLYILSGTLDIFDGRLARATGKSSASGGFLDSVADRWGEIAVFAGFVWLLRGTSWVMAPIAALAGSMMVSYVRAAGEARGVAVKGGIMQRAERITLVSMGLLAGAWLGASASTVEYVVPTLGWTLAIVGFSSSVTACGRWLEGYRALRQEDLQSSAVLASARAADKSKDEREDAQPPAMPERYAS